MQEVRLTPTSYIVLGLLEFAGESTPYGLKQLVAGVGRPLLDAAARPALHRARAPGRGRLRDGDARGGGPPAQALRDHRPRARGARRLARDDHRQRARRAARARAAEALLRRRSGRLAEAQLPAHRAKLAEYEAHPRRHAGRRPRRPAAGARAGHPGTSASSIAFWEELAGTARVPARWPPPQSPRPAELPLPGGRDGAKVRLHPLLTGDRPGAARAGSCARRAASPGARLSGSASRRTSGSKRRSRRSCSSTRAPAPCSWTPASTAPWR